MADRFRDAPENHTAGAKMRRIFGQDHDGRNGLHVFGREYFDNFTMGKSVGNMFAAAAIGAVVSIPVSMVAGGIIDKDAAVDQQISGKRNLINGYGITNIDGTSIAVIKGEDGHFEAYVNNSGDWLFIESAERAKKYAEAAIAEYQSALAESELEKDGNGAYLPKTSTAGEISYPYIDADGYTYRELSSVNARKEGTPEEQRAYFEKMQEFWQDVADNVTSNPYGIPANSYTEYNDDYRYWNNTGDVYQNLMQYGGLGWLAIAGLMSIPSTRKRLVPSQQLPGRRRRTPK